MCFLDFVTDQLRISEKSIFKLSIYVNLKNQFFQQSLPVNSIFLQKYTIDG